jgi:hypothetical protein
MHVTHDALAVRRAIRDTLRRTGMPKGERRAAEKAALAYRAQLRRRFGRDLPMGFLAFETEAGWTSTWVYDVGDDPTRRDVADTMGAESVARVLG